MHRKLAAHVSLIALMIVLARAEEAQAQKIKERLASKAVRGGGERVAAARIELRLRRHPARLRERARVYEPLIAAAAERHGVDPRALWTIAYLETRFRPDVVSPQGARGLMQFMPATARAYQLHHPHRPAEAIEAAARHVRHLTRRYGPRLDLILASYHAGESAVDAYLRGNSIRLPNGKVINRRKLRTGGVPPYRGTQKYVARGLRIFARVAAEHVFTDELLAQLTPLTVHRRLAHIPPHRKQTSPVALAAPQPGDRSHGASSSTISAPRGAARFYDVHSGERFLIHDLAQEAGPVGSAGLAFEK